MVSIYEDKYMFYVWKPNNIPTTYWKNYSFLEFLEDNLDKIKLINQNFYNHILKYKGLYKELLLLNRLDTPTGGLLYFAKNENIFNQYKILQNKGRVEKIYLCDVYWKIKNSITISWPIMHHKYLKEKMVVIKKENDLNKWRGKLHNVETKIYPIYYDEVKNITTLEVIIKKGVRHQIRVHLSSIWHPIVWDKLYARNVSDDILHLRSIWLKIK